ncbi:MAG TPA: hypothetical protein VFB06_03430 [Streptosporangiaceae bacterium]|nr:hypothetical protein [Streptosporangiaceae bacterium]
MIARASSSRPHSSRNRGDSGIQWFRATSSTPVGKLISHSSRHPKCCGDAHVEASQLTTTSAVKMLLPISTIIQPRCRRGTVSLTSANPIGNIPPAATPMKKHDTRFIQYLGIAPHVELAMNNVAANKIEARRPIRSPSHPQISDPATVPAMPTSGYSPTGSACACGFSGPFSPYSTSAPGITNANAAGFIPSIVTATAITISSPRCAGRSGASSSGAILTVLSSGLAWRPRGNNPYAASTKPRNIVAIAASIRFVTAIPARS